MNLVAGRPERIVHLNSEDKLKPDAGMGHIRWSGNVTWWKKGSSSDPKFRIRVVTLYTLHFSTRTYVNLSEVGENLCWKKKQTPKQNKKGSFSFVVWDVLGVLSTQLKVTREAGAAVVLFAHIEKVSAGRKPDFLLVFNVLRLQPWQRSGKSWS